MTISTTLHINITVSSLCMLRPIADDISDIQKKIGKGVRVLIKNPCRKKALFDLANQIASYISKT